MKVLKVCVVSCALLASNGCTSRYGAIYPNHKFVFPNSNVEPLGPTSVSRSKTSVFTTPQFSFEEVRDMQREALAAVPGANVLINYSEDTTVTLFPTPFPFATLTYEISGIGAKMEVGIDESVR